MGMYKELFSQLPNLGIGWGIIHLIHPFVLKETAEVDL